jgi:hypothetical protein
MATVIHNNLIYLVEGKKNQAERAGNKEQVIGFLQRVQDDIVINP